MFTTSNTYSNKSSIVAITAILNYLNSSTAVDQSIITHSLLHDILSQV